MEGTPDSDGAPSPEGPLGPRPTEAQRAFSYWATKTERQIFAEIKRRVHNADTAWELTQETYRKAWMNWNQFDPANGTFPAWVSTIALNTVYDHKRAERRRPKTVPLGSDVTPDDDSRGPIPGPRDPKGDESVVDEVITAEARAAIRLEDGLLPEADRELFHLYYEEKLSYSEISQRTGRSESAVGAALTRARKKLSEKLSPHAP